MFFLEFMCFAFHMLFLSIELLTIPGKEPYASYDKRNH